MGSSHRILRPEVIGGRVTWPALARIGDTLRVANAEFRTSFDFGSAPAAEVD